MSTNDIHQWVEERLSEYLDNRLAPNERTRLEEHLRECARCQASLESLRWTVSLLKQAPAPALPRAFTLPVARRESRAGGFAFGFFGAATVIATVLLCFVVGLDFYLSSRSISPGLLSAPAAQFAQPTQNIALAPQPAPTNIPPTAAPAPTNIPPTSAPAAPPAPTSAPRPTIAPPQPAQPATLPTSTRALSAGAAELRATPAQADQTLKTAATAPALSPVSREGITRTVPSAPPAPVAAITATLTLPSPSPTSAPSATSLAPTVTARAEAQALVQPTAAPTHAPVAEAARPAEFPWRAAEIGLAALVVALGALAILVRRRK